MLIKAIGVGAKRNWREILGSLLKVWGVVWLVTNSGAFFSYTFKLFVEAHLSEIVIGAALFAMLYAFYSAKVDTKVSFRIKTTNTKVTIRFGDLFNSPGHIIIPVNEFFDSEVGRPVASSSVHGQFIHRVLGGNAAKFNADVDRYLENQTTEVIERPFGRPRRYAIGTTAVITEGTRKYFLFALTKTDPITCEASADLSQMLAALAATWRSVRAEANGEGVHLPLVGGGLARIGLESIHLLRLALLTILIETRSAPITRQIEIVLHESLFSQIDLRSVAADWR